MAVYIYMAQGDEYYGVQKARDAYNGLHDAYAAAGWTDEQIDTVLQMQTPDNAFFDAQGLHVYHVAANVVFDDADILNWIVSKQTTTQTYTRTTPIETVRNDPVFGDYGRLIFPVERSYYSGDTLEQLHLTYYNNIDPDETVDICNTLRQRAADGQTIFYDIYTEDEKAADPDKADTGLFYFKGNSGAKFSICNAGGAFAYVGAMQDSFPHALELSRKEYNAFALIYRPGAQTACEDLARAIAFVFAHAEELEVDTSGYSLWGGSAGARMAAWLGSYGTASFGEQAYPQPGAVIMQYTGLGEVYGNEPPTYACVGDRDYIADERVMRWRIETIRSQGTPAEIEVFPGLAHGFGLGTGTSAEGWLDHAVAFWEENT